jgi:hypothetical protein
MRCVLMTLLLGLLLGPALPAHAGDDKLPDQVRADAEYAVLDGRPQDLYAVLANHRQDYGPFPLILANYWWRKTPAPAVRPDAAGALSDPERWAFLGRSEAPYPAAPGGGAVDPYPLLRALIADRIQRETHGSAGLPAASPLAAYLEATGGGRDKDEAQFIGFALEMMTRSYIGDDNAAEAFRADAAARKLHDRNRLLFLTGLGALLVLSFVATLVVGRRRG